MKIEIINKPMLCWDYDESKAIEWHVLAKVTECDTTFQFKVIANDKTDGEPLGQGCGFKNAKPIPEIIELTVEEISKLLGKTVKIVK